MKQDIHLGMKLLKCRSKQVFIIINNVRTKINVGLNVKNWLKKVCVIKNLFGINYVMLESI